MPPSPQLCFVRRTPLAIREPRAIRPVLEINLATAPLPCSTFRHADGGTLPPAVPRFFHPADTRAPARARLHPIHPARPPAGLHPAPRFPFPARPSTPQREPLARAPHFSATHRLSLSRPITHRPMPGLTRRVSRAQVTTKGGSLARRPALGGLRDAARLA